MMDSLRTLATVLEHAERERDDAMARLRQAETALRNAQTQAEQLRQYRGEYQQRWNERFRQPGTIELLHCVQGFGQRLDQAVTMQSHSASQAESRLAQARELLLAREQRVAAVRKLIERRQGELRRVAERRDQRQTDEAAARAGSLRRLQGSHGPTH